MSFFKMLGKIIGDSKCFVEEMESNELERKKSKLQKLKLANKKKSEREELDKAISEERKKLRSSDDYIFGGGL